MLHLIVLPILASFCEAVLVANTTNHSCCNALNQKLPGKVFFPGSAEYEAEEADYYSLIPAQQTPACRFNPLSDEDVSEAVILFTKYECKFAVVSGGHMPWAGMSNIDAPGITIDMGNFSTVTVLGTGSNDRVVQVGPGQSWGSVYDQLDKYNLTAVGGRATTVGVGGFLLGGGISYFNPRYGLAAQNVINYHMILADGQIVDVNTSSYPDLHEALNGGSTNFGIVTRYDIKTYPLVPMWGGFRNYELSEQAPLINGTLSFMEKQINDTLAGGAIFSYSRPFNTSNVILGMLVAYFNGDGPLSDAFDDIINVPFINGTDQFQDNVDQQILASEVDDRFEGGRRAMFSTITFAGDVQFPQDIFNKARELYDSEFGSYPNVSWAASFQANGRAVWRKVAETPNFQGVETDRDLFVFVLVSYSIDASLDDKLIAWHHTTMDWINSTAQDRGLASQWIYLNYARPDQAVYPSFGEENHAQLKAIKEKYDPQNVFGRLWPGGFKL